MKTFSLVLSTILLSLLFSAAAIGQTSGSVSGKVSDANGKGVSGSQVTLTLKNNASVTFTATAGADGSYRLENIPAGEYVITASDGTPANTKRANENVNIAAGQNTALDLTVLAVVTAEVTIASGTAQTFDEVSKSVSTVTGQEIENRDEQTVADALRTVPGFRVQQSGGFGRITTIKIRGLRNQDTAILIDGQRFRDATAITGDASSFLGDLVTTGVGQVEVLRGSGSSLYGTNAIGGVVNVQTDTFSNDLKGEFLAEGGGLGFVRGRAGISGGLHNKALFSAVISHNNYQDGIDGDDAAHNTSGKAGARFVINDKTQITSRFYVSDGFVRLNSSPDTIGTLPPITSIVTAFALSPEELHRYEAGTPIGSLNANGATFIPDADDPDSFAKSRFYDFNVALDGSINPKALYRVSYQDLWTKRKTINGPAGVGFQPFGGSEQSNFNGDIQTFQAKTNLILRSNVLTIGYGFEREKFGNDNFGVGNVGNNSIDVTQSSNTLVVQDQVAAFDSRLQLSGAFRAQFFSLGQPTFSANNPPYQNLTLGNIPAAYTVDASAAWFFRSTGTKLRSHIGNGYRVASLYERFGTFYDTFSIPNNFVALGDPNLKSERSVGFDAGLDQEFSSDRVHLSATYFYTRLLDTIGFADVVPDIGTTPRPFGGYLNQDGGIARGGELSAEFTPFRSTRIFTSYTYTKSLQSQSQVPGSGVLKTLGVPESSFTAVFNQQITKRFNFSFDLVAYSSYRAPIFSNTIFSTRIYRFSGMKKADISAGYEIPTSNDKIRFRLFGTIENLFDTDNFENGFRTAGITGRGGVKVSF
jgi:iron complex outermembrane receptor protein